MDPHDTPSSSGPHTHSSTPAPTGQKTCFPPWVWRYPGPVVPICRDQTYRLSPKHLSDRTLRCRKSRQLHFCALLSRHGSNISDMRNRMWCGWFALRICFLRCRIHWRRCFRRVSTSGWLSRWCTWWRCWGWDRREKKKYKNRCRREELVGMGLGVEMDLGGCCLKCNDLVMLLEAGHFDY